MENGTLEELVKRGVESEVLDYKSAMNWNLMSRSARAKIIRHCLAMANTKGGSVVIGVGEDASGHPSDYQGLSPEEVHSFDPSTVGAFINRYVEPPIDFTIERPEVDGRRYAIFMIRPFKHLPHVCSQNVENELQQGAFYIRTPDASSRIAYRAIEMQNIIQRALRNQREALGRMLRGILYETQTSADAAAGAGEFAAAMETARQFFNRRRKSRTSGLRAEFAVIPQNFEADRFTLTGVNALDTAAHDFRHIRTRVNGYDKDSGRHEGQSLPVRCERVAPVNYHCLHHHGCSAKNLNIDSDHSIHDLLQPANHRIL